MRDVTFGKKTIPDGSWWINVYHNKQEDDSVLRRRAGEINPVMGNDGEVDTYKVNFDLLFNTPESMVAAAKALFDPNAKLRTHTGRSTEYDVFSKTPTGGDIPAYKDDLVAHITERAPGTFKEGVSPFTVTVREPSWQKQGDVLNRDYDCGTMEQAVHQIKQVWPGGLKVKRRDVWAIFDGDKVFDDRNPDKKLANVRTSNGVWAMTFTGPRQPTVVKAKIYATEVLHTAYSPDKPKPKRRRRPQQQARTRKPTEAETETRKPVKTRTRVNGDNGDRNAKIISARKAGTPVKDIAKEFGLSTVRIYRITKKS